MKWILAIISAVVLGGILIYIFYYNKGHRNIQAERADFELPANEMVAEFLTDEAGAFKKFNEKVVLVSGTVKQVINGQSGNTIVLLDGSEGLVNCEIVHTTDNAAKEAEVGENARIKGLFIGYNDLLGEIQLKHCTIVN